LIVPVSFEGLLAPDIFVGLLLCKEDGDIEGISLVEIMGVVAGRLFGDTLGEVEETPLVGLALGAEEVVDPARALLEEKVGESLGNELWDNRGFSEGKAVGPLEAEADSCIVVLDRTIGEEVGASLVSEFSEGKAVGPMEAEADSCIVMLDRVLLVFIE
jgi:hypothetical protein